MDGHQVFVSVARPQNDIIHYDIGNVVPFGPNQQTELDAMGSLARAERDSWKATDPSVLVMIRVRCSRYPLPPTGKLNWSPLE